MHNIFQSSILCTVSVKFEQQLINIPKLNFSGCTECKKYVLLKLKAFYKTLHIGQFTLFLQLYWYLIIDLNYKQKFLLKVT